MLTFDRLLRRLLLSLGLGFAVLVALSLYADLPRLVEAFGRFHWAYLPAVLGLTVFNYGLRFVKWEYYLGLIGARPGRADSLTIFLSGFSMVMTPGKVGEVLKSVLLRRAVGTPISRSVPVLLAERLSDGLAMLLLASTGLALYSYGRPVLLFILALAVGVVLAVQYPPFVAGALGLAARVPILAPRIQHLAAFYESAQALLGLRPMALAVMLGFFSWGAESVAFFLVLVGLGLSPDALLLVKATFILATSTLIGASSMLPGGLGAAEGSITWMLLADLAREEAAAATILIRFCTLWFGVLLGSSALILRGRRFLADDRPTGFQVADAAAAARVAGS